MSRGKKQSTKKGGQTVTVTDGRAMGSRAQAPPGGSFVPPTTHHHDHVQAIQGSAPQQTATMWQRVLSLGYWASSWTNPAVGTAASKYGSTWQEHNDFYAIGLLLPGHLELVPKLLELFPDTEELTGIINATKGNKGDELKKLQEKNILSLLAKSAPRLIGLLEADINDKLVELHEQTLNSLEELASKKEVHLIKQLKVSTLNALTPLMEARLLEKYVNVLSASLEKLAGCGQLLAKMEPAQVKQLVDSFGVEGFTKLTNLPIPDLELLAPGAAAVHAVMPEVGEVNTHLKNISVQELLNLCSCVKAANLRILLEKIPSEEIYQLARLPSAAAMTKEISLLIDLGQTSIGWNELALFGNDNARKFGEGNQGTKKLTKHLQMLSGEWKQLKNASYSIGEALRILITTKKPEKARKIIEDSTSAAKLHEAVAAITKLIDDKKQLSVALAATLFNDLTAKSLAKLLRGTTVLEAANFITEVDDAAKLNELLAQDIKISYLMQLTGAHTATLLTHTDAVMIKGLADNFKVAELTEIIKEIPAAPLKNLLSGLNIGAFTLFVKKFGIHDAPPKKGLITLEDKYTTASLKKYGYEFFEKFQGVTNATMHHVINGDGINNGVSGCHDRAKFMAQPGIDIISDTARAGTAIYDVEYTIPPNAKVYRKTLIDNLDANKADWRRRATEALDYAIKKQLLIVGNKWIGSSTDGYQLEGYYGGKAAHVMDTFYVS